LGVGKTTLIRETLKILGISGNIKSPSFTLVEPYQYKNLTLYHFDLYRFSSPDEWFDAGFNEYFMRIVFVLLNGQKKLALASTIDIEIKINIDSDNQRVAVISDIKNILQVKKWLCYNHIISND